MKISINLEKRIALVDGKTIKIPEEELRKAIAYFIERVEASFWNNADEEYQTIKKADEIISEYLLRYALKIHTCPHCKSENVDFHHIDRCADLPF